MVTPQEMLENYMESIGYNLDELILACRLEDCNDKSKVSIIDKCVKCKKDVFIGPMMKDVWEKGTKIMCQNCIINFIPKKERGFDERPIIH